MTAASGTKLEPTAEAALQASSLLLAQKTDLIGELAQAVANNFNNIMMAVTGYAELELKKSSTKDPRALEQILGNATHATSLVQLLLDFSRKHSPSPQPLELNAVITELRELSQELLGEQIDLSLRLDPEPPSIYADKVEIQQALLALFVIARNAIAPPGRLTISTSLSQIDQDFIGTEDRAEPGEFVVLSVDSNSAANPRSANPVRPDSLTSSFEAVRAIVKQSRGLVRISSESGAGGNFKLYFPASRTQSSHEPGPVLPRTPALARTILVVEDDDAVRVPAAEFLKMEGFKVLQARTGTEALQLVQQSRSSLDILIADIFMPKMSGHEVAAKLLEQHPDLKVLYMSGDPSRPGPAGTRKIPHNATLRKPFRLNVLRDKIHDLLGE
jgi:CheY-like chemotaxis protein